MRVANVASQADVCYNEGRNIVVSGDAVNTPDRTHVVRTYVMDTIPSTSGIYKITCAANKKIYIGSSVNLRKRQTQHWRGLQQNRHDNPHMQRSWNKYGEQTFTFEVLEQVLPISLTAREQYWFKKLRPFGRKGFNVQREAGSQLGLKHTPETREKVRQAGLGRKRTPESIEKTASALRGRKLSPEAIEKLIQAQGTPEMREKKRQSLLGLKRSPEEIKKSRQARSGIKRSSEIIEKMRQASTGRVKTPEEIEKIRQASLGRKHTPEACEKIGNAHRGKTISPETREKLRQASLNMSAETKEKIRQTNTGKKASPETKEKLRQAQLGRQRDEGGKFT